MSAESKWFVVLGCVFLATGGALAAFGFHGPADILPPEKRASWGWAVDMQFYHGGGLILVGVLMNLCQPSWWLRGAGALMAAGIVVFSIFVYLGSLGITTALAGFVPNGGFMLMASWVVLAIGVIRQPSGKD